MAFISLIMWVLLVVVVAADIVVANYTSVRATNIASEVVVLA